MQKGMENIKNRPGSLFLKSRNSNLYEVIILKSWWVILFFLLCTFAYDKAIRHKKLEENKLSEKLFQLEKEYEIALARQEDLKLQIASFDDEAFIELTLMRRLGLVPEGQTKVHFINP